MGPSHQQQALELEALRLNDSKKKLMQKYFSIKTELKCGAISIFLSSLTVRPNDMQDGGQISVSNIVLIDDFH